jgi:carbonic anhydrase
MTPLPSPRLLAVALALTPALAFAQQEWTYAGKQGPTHWASLQKQYGTCGSGKHQSPIDVRGAKPAGLPAIEFTYAPSPYKIVDNGHTVQVSPAGGNAISVGGHRYDLIQFHFHHPAEERIEGKSFPMVVHLVHKDAGGKLAVVAVLLKHGRANPFLDSLWKNLPRDVGQEHAPEGASVDLNQLLPADRGYYTFTGSLTTPPCSEDVTWFVLKAHPDIDKAEEAAFAAKYAHNARPIQPLNGRTVQASR